MTLPPLPSDSSPWLPLPGEPGAKSYIQPAPPLPSPPPQSFSTPYLWLCLILLTALGAFLRFWRLDFQAYWTDEAYTINRIRGTFAFMLDQLADQGFPPGWYALLRGWRIFLERFMTPGNTYLPQYLRMLPAFCGTLTVPAMYFLARQFTDRRGALLVMLLTAVNPFLIYYSRDLKMYAALCFFVALNMALFLHWQTTRRHLLWFPLYLLTGIAMTATHSMAWAIIALQLIFLLTRPRPKAWDAPLWALAAAAMAAIPVYWYYEYLQPARWSGRLANDVDQSMYWISDYTDMSWRTLASLPTSHILGYLWPVYPPDTRIYNWFLLGGKEFEAHLAQRSWPWMASGQWYAALALFAILLLGLIPWRHMPTPLPCPPERAASVTRGRWWWVLLWIVLPSAALALTWIPPDSPWFARVWHGLNPKPLWEPRYLGIIVPAWLLWLAASLRRLPTAPLRLAAILAVTGVCAYSSLSNHLIYRNAPFHRAAALLEEYADPTNRSATAVAVPLVKYPDPAENMATNIARRIVPGTEEDPLNIPWFPGSRDARPPRPPWLWPPGLATPNQVVAWLQDSVANNASIKVLILTDRYGDIEDKTHPLSNESLQRILGPQWHLIHEEKYAWHYEWRFYIFHLWRTRIWQQAP